MLALQRNNFVRTIQGVSHFPTKTPNQFGQLISNPNIHTAAVSQNQLAIISICDGSSETVSTTECNSYNSEIVPLATEKRSYMLKH